MARMGYNGGGSTDMDGNPITGTPEEQRNLFRSGMSEFPGDRQNLFQQFQAASPHIQTLNPMFRSLIGRLGNPASAQYQLNTFSNPQGTGNFWDFLGEGGLNRFSNVDFGNQLQNLRGMGLLPGQGESLANYGTRFEGDTAGQARFAALNDEDFVRNLIFQAGQSGLSPGLRGYARRGLSDSINRFRANDPAGNLFDEFNRRGL